LETLFHQALQNCFPPARCSRNRLLGILIIFLGRATLARWHLAHDDPEAAAAAAARSRTLAADDPETALISFEVALATDDLAAAEQAITGRLVAHPDDERMHRAAALLATRRGRLEEAVAAIRDGLAHQPESSPLQATLAELLLLQGSIADAREVIDTLAAVEGDDAPRVALLEGWCLVEERQWPRAKQVLQRLRPQMATDDRLRGQIDLLLARCHGSLGAFDEQLTICENLLAAPPAAGPPPAPGPPRRGPATPRQ